MVKKLLIFGIMFLMTISLVLGAYYVKDPDDCPTSYMSQDCTPNDVCGYSNPIVYCYDTSTITPPSTYVVGYQSQISSGLGAGYVMDCYSKDLGTPFCDTWLCSLNSTCYTTRHRTTNCTSTTTSNCIGCLSNYYDCNADGVICEIHNGDACTTPYGTSGTYSGCSGAVGNCVGTKSYFQTGTIANYGTTDPLLWGKQYGNGSVISLSDANNVTLIMNESGIYYNGTQIGSTSGNWEEIIIDSNNYLKPINDLNNVYINKSIMMGIIYPLSFPDNSINDENGTTGFNMEDNKLLLHFEGDLSDSSGNNILVKNFTSYTTSFYNIKVGNRSLQANPEPLNITNYTSLNYNNGGISVWFKTYETDCQTIFSASEGDDDDSYMRIGIGACLPSSISFVGDATVTYEFHSNHYNSTTSNIYWGTISSINEFADGRWHHLMFTFESGDYPRFYIDGTASSSGATANVTFTNWLNPINKDNIIIGALRLNNSMGDAFNGFLDEFALFNSTSSLLNFSRYQSSFLYQKQRIGKKCNLSNIGEIVFSGYSSSEYNINPPPPYYGRYFTRDSVGLFFCGASVRDSNLLLDWIQLNTQFHDSLYELYDDDHKQYALLSGRSGGQKLYGGIGNSQGLTLQSTSNINNNGIIRLNSTSYIGVATGSLAYKNANRMYGYQTFYSNTSSETLKLIQYSTTANRLIQSWYENSTQTASLDIEGDFQHDGKLTTGGEAEIGGITGDGTGKVVCIKSDGDLGTCTSIVDVGGTCTCT